MSPGRSGRAAGRTIALLGLTFSMAPDAHALTREALRNAVYLSRFVGSGRVMLVDGKAEVVDSEARVLVTLTDFVAIGDLNGDSRDDAAAILLTSMGGSGSFCDLVAVIDADGAPLHIGTAPLGDRVKPESIGIADRQVQVRMVAHKPREPLCCPTLSVTRNYVLQGTGLREEPGTQGVPRAGDAADVERRGGGDVDRAPVRDGGGAGVVREEQPVRVGKTTELWRLVWRAPPQPACAPDDGVGGWDSRPCDGFAFGERGDLDLIRVRDGRVVERLPITPFFDVLLTPWEVAAVLPRRAVREGDFEKEQQDGGKFIAELQSRPDVKIMQPRDYDHDGRATEFFLQLSSSPCGKRMGIVIGVSRDNDRLHAFGTARHPDKPLVLRVDHWGALAGARGPLRLIAWECGDHGSDTRDVLEALVDAGGIHVTGRNYLCNDDGTPGPLLTTEEP